MENQVEEKVKNNLTEIVFILDRSGSMSGFEKDVIGGFNSTIEKQKQEEGTAFVSTLLFDHETKVVHDRVPLEKIPPLTDGEYQVRGTTALLDAIGGAIRHIGNIHKYARKEDVPERTLFVITTDGMENASREYTRSQIKEMIERQKNRYGWEFIFLAANIDAVETAAAYGIDEDCAVGYDQTPEGIDCSYELMEKAIRICRRRESLDGGDWKRRKK